MGAFKDEIGPEAIGRIGRCVRDVVPGFSVDAFVATTVPGLAPLELKARVSHVARCLRGALDPEWPRAAAQVHAALPAGLAEDEGLSTHFWAWPLLTLVEEHGVDYPDVSLDLLRALTGLWSAEFAIRPYLDVHPSLTLDRLARWVDDPSPHVRRLVSEGSRPRLPWGRRLPAFVRDPGPMIPLLERLLDDPVDFVRLSVSNHLNDISKDHPELAVALARRWSDGSAARDRVVRHGLRTLVKAGHRGALDAVGAGPLAVRATLDVTPTVALGDAAQLAATLVADTDGDAIIDLAVVRPTKTGRARKVWKWAKRRLTAGKTVYLERSFSLADVTVRTWHPGAYDVELVVNGHVAARATFIAKSSNSKD